MKDVPIIDRSARLVIASVPERGSPAEALVSTGDMRLKDLVKGSRVGTSNPVRVAQLRRARPDLIPEPLWGDVETRVEKVDRGEFDATILAEAGEGVYSVGRRKGAIVCGTFRRGERGHETRPRDRRGTDRERREQDRDVLAKRPPLKKKAGLFPQPLLHHEVFCARSPFLEWF